MVGKKYFAVYCLLILGIVVPVLVAYANYNEMKANHKEGEDYVIDYRRTDSDVAVIAIHGGAIEPGTTEIADDIASDEYTFYTNLGLKSKDNFKMHVTSTNYDEPIARDLVSKSNWTLSIHGCKGTRPITYIGGLDEELKDKVRTELKKAGFIVEDAPSSIGAEDRRNICNLNIKGAGVQLELTYKLRQSFFKSMAKSGRQTKTEVFYKYVNAIKAALKDLE